MAHFAQLDRDNNVMRVIAVSNDFIRVNGQDSEERGIKHCQSISGPDTIWKQTSYNGNFRGRFAGKGYTYSEVLDEFVKPKPFPSWKFDVNTKDWVSPVAKPELTDEEFANQGQYVWDEFLYNDVNSNTGWVLIYPYDGLPHPQER